MFWGLFGGSGIPRSASPQPTPTPPPRPASPPPAARRAESDTFVSSAAKGTYIGGRIGGRHLDVQSDLGNPQAGNRVRIVDKTQGRVDGATGKPRGVSILRIDDAHNRVAYPHLNVRGMPPALKSLERLDHLRIPRVPDGALGAMRHGGKALIVVGIAADVIDFRRSQMADRARSDGLNTEVRKSAGRIAGGWGGAAAGAALGATIGSVVPGLGTAIGGLVGGFVGGIGGSVGGSKLGEWIASR